MERQPLAVVQVLFLRGPMSWLELYKGTSLANGNYLDNSTDPSRTHLKLIIQCMRTMAYLRSTELETENDPDTHSTKKDEKARKNQSI